MHGTGTFAAGALGSPGSVRFYNPELDVAYMKRATVSGNTAVANAGLRSGVMAHLSLADLILHGLDAPTAKQLVRTAAMPTVVADAPQLETGFAAAPSRAAAIGLVGQFDLGGFPGGALSSSSRRECAAETIPPWTRRPWPTGAATSGARFLTGERFLHGRRTVPTTGETSPFSACHLCDERARNLFLRG